MITIMEKKHRGKNVQVEADIEDDEFDENSGID